MTRAPLVSIGMPVFNGEAYLADAIESHLSQTFTDFELIICDNASTDRTPDIITRYADRDKRIRRIRHASNIGAMRNYESAFALARGKYFRWAAADDLIAPTMLERCAAALEAHPEAVLAYGGTELIDGSGQTIGYYEERLAIGAPSAATRLDHTLVQLELGNVLYGLMRADTLAQTSRLQAFVGADLCFIAEMSLYGSFIELPAPLFFRRMHAAASSAMNEAALLQFYHPNTTRKEITLKRLRHLRANLGSVMRAPLSLSERWKCVSVLLKHARWMRQRHWRELAHLAMPPRFRASASEEKDPPRSAAVETFAAAAQRPSRLGVTARNVLSNWGGQLFSLVTAFFVSPYVVRHLGGTEYGVWSLMATIASYMALLDLGTRGAVMRYVAKYHAQHNHLEGSVVTSTAMAIFIAAGGITIAISAGIGPLVDEFFEIPPELVSSARIVLFASAFSVALTLIGATYSSVLAALQRFDLLNAIDIGTAIFRTAGIVMVLALGGRIVGMAVIIIISALLRFVVGIAAARAVYPELLISLRRVSRSHLPLIFGYSAFSFLINVGDRVIYFSDSIVIAAMLPVAAVAYFSIAVNLVEVVRTIASGISQTLSPLASSMEARGELADLQTLVLASSRVCSILSYPVLGTFLLRGPSFISIWMDPTFGPESGRILQILTIYLVLTSATHTALGVLFGIERHRPLAVVTVAEGVLNLSLSIVLVRPLGLEGIAWGTTIPRVLTAAIFWPFYLRRVLGIGIRDFAWQSWIRPALGAAPFLAATWWIEVNAPAASMIVFMLQTAALLPVAAIAAWLISCTRHDRQLVRARVVQNVQRMIASPSRPVA